MSEKFENTIKRVGQTKYITAPVDMIRNMAGSVAVPMKTRHKSKIRLLVFMIVLVVIFGGFLGYLSSH